MFKPLTKDSIGNIVKLLLDDLNKRVADKELKITLTPAAEEYVISKGYDPVYGARPLKRYLQKNVETLVARAILGNTLKMGDNIVIDCQNDELVINKS